MDPASSECPYCAAGLPHPNGRALLTVRGSVMRRGGVYTDPGTGIELGTNEWVRVRCDGCGVESMTPIECLEDIGVEQLGDGTHTSHCMACMRAALFGQHRPRRRRRHG